MAAASCAFGLTVAASFHFDDYALFSDPAITSPSGAWEVWRPVQTRPLTYFTFWLNYQLGGANPVGYHVVNLLLHIAASVLLLAVLRLLLAPRIAFVAAMLFAIHPIATEPIAYVFARGTILCTLLCLASLWYWLRDRPWIAATIFAAALLAKEECVAFPALLLGLWLTGPRLRRQLAPIAAMLLLSLAAGLHVLWAATKIQGSGIAASAGVSPLEYLSFQGVAILRYLSLLIVPWGFTVDPEITAGPLARALAWAAIAFAIAIALRWFKGRLAGFWFLAGLVLLAPSSSIFPAADLAADRRVYLPLIALAPCAAMLVARWQTRWLAIIAALLIGISIRYSLVWQTERSLWTEALAHAPGKARPRLQLARAVEPARALQLLAEAQSIAPADPAVASEQGKVLLEAGRPAEALAAFGRALALSPGNPDALNNRGVALQSLGQTDAAQQDFQRALRIDPCHFNARLNLLRLGGTPPPLAPRCTN